MVSDEETGIVIIPPKNVRATRRVARSCMDCPLVSFLVIRPTIEIVG